MPVSLPHNLLYSYFALNKYCPILILFIFILSGFINIYCTSFYVLKAKSCSLFICFNSLDITLPFIVLITFALIVMYFPIVAPNNSICLLSVKGTTASAPRSPIRAPLYGTPLPWLVYYSP